MRKSGSMTLRLMSLGAEEVKEVMRSLDDNNESQHVEHADIYGSAGCTAVFAGIVQYVGFFIN